jgi:hypothetical protein
MEIPLKSDAAHTLTQMARKNRPDPRWISVVVIVADGGCIGKLPF